MLKKISEKESLAFDSLRGISALIVAFSHAIQFFLLKNHPELKGFVGIFSQGAVSIFFILSGFMIGKSIQRSIQQDTFFDFTNYCKNRAKRIYPPLIFSFIICFFLYVAMLAAGISSHLQIKESFASLFFLNNFLTENPKINSVVWSLSYEVWCYILFGMLYVKKYIYYFFVGIIFFILIYLDIKFIFYFFMWSFGLLFSYIHNRINNYSIVGAFFITVVSLMCWCYFALQLTRGTLNSFSIDFYNLSTSLLCCCLIFILMKNKLFKFNILSQTAKFSYTLYITHMPIIILSSFIINPSTKNLFLAVTMMFIVFILCIYFAKYTGKFIEDSRFIKKLLTINE